MKIDENSVKINEIDDDDDDDDCGGDGGSSSILYLKTPDQSPLAATMLNLINLINPYFFPNSVPLKGSNRGKKRVQNVSTGGHGASTAGRRSSAVPRGS